ncbi:MAG: hypothetical protein EOP07_16085 [Proteobacteria bacterium]|nr:MAG: hypothetical protein EOP07_16085 [Pseudomonadota bacterium]
MNRLLSAVMISSSLLLTVACGSDDKDSSTKGETLRGQSSYREEGSYVVMPATLELKGSGTSCGFVLPASFSLNAISGGDVELSASVGQEPFMRARPTETRLYRGDEEPSRELSATVEENGVQKDIKIFFAENEVSVEVVCLYNYKNAKSSGGGWGVSPGYINR